MRGAPIRQSSSVATRGLQKTQGFGMIGLRDTNIPARPDNGGHLRVAFGVLSLWVLRILCDFRPAYAGTLYANGSSRSRTVATISVKASWRQVVTT